MTVWTDMGSIQNFPVTPSPTTTEHKIARGGLKRVDLVGMTLLKFGFATKLDEWTPDNMLMALLGENATDTAGAYIKLGVAPVRRQLKFVGDNRYGARWEVIFPSVFINAKDALDFLGSDDFAAIPLSGDILFDDTLGAFGTARPLSGATGSAPVTSPSVLNYYIGTGILYSAPVA